MTFLIIIDPYTINVDRWSAIHNFIQSLFNGSYPYSAHTHLGGYGSPFPAWQVFHIPFYILGNVGFGMLFSVILTGILLIWLLDSHKDAFFYLLLLTLSPAFWYEVVVRSDLFYNFLLCFLVFGVIYKKHYSIISNSIFLGFITGLFLSTRFSTIIPFSILLFPSFLISNIKYKIIFIASGIITFIATFLPFVFWDFNTLFFFKYNPFILQTRQGSVLDALIIALIGIYLSFCWKNDLKLCSTFISITISALVIITFSHRMISDHFVSSFFSGYYDITYFNMAMPFILFSLNQGKINIQNNTSHVKTKI
ncbi:MAG: hypothetical protein ACOYMA_21195 [Bacteroidia bacterium]